MNYRHGFHAGNHADVLKHLALVLILARLRAKETPFAVLDTHAGRGGYELDDDAAQRSPEWRDGIGRLWDWAQAPAEAAPYLAAVRAFNGGGALTRYPGSPALIAQALRAQDRVMACELNPEEARALKQCFAGQANVQAHQRDAWEAVTALTPFPERRGLVLIDPPYEREGELEAGAAAMKRIEARFGHGVALWWRPLKDAAALAAADAEITGPVLRADLAVAAPEKTGKLTASSVLVRNPPFGLEAALRAALPALSARLARGPGAGWRVDLRD